MSDYPIAEGLSRRAHCRHGLGAVNGGGSVDGYRHLVKLGTST
jgi:hypothetical protein